MSNSNIPIEITCKYCNHLNHKWTDKIAGYSGVITKCFWCEECDEIQAVKFTIDRYDKVHVFERLKATEVIIPKVNEKNITISRKKKQ